jgi:hypothetical protein
MCMEMSITYASPDRDFGDAQTLGSLFDADFCQSLFLSCTCAVMGSW